MSKVLTNNQYYSQIANIIREQNGTNNTYTPPQMVRALKDLFYEEVEGVPPITFQGIGENLLDYRIDGASGGVGDLITDSSDENFGKYKVSVVCGGTITNIYLDKPIEAKANIPNEYTEVEYIETDGNQYINIPFDNTNVSINKYYYKYMHRNSISQAGTILGNATDLNRIGMLWFRTDGTTRISVGNVVSTSSKFNTNTILQKKIEATVLVDNQNQIYSVNYNGAEYNNKSFYGSSQTSEGLKIFGTGSGTNQTANIVLYRMKIYSDNVLIRDFIPCYRKSDTVAGLYDLVNSIFYTNQGTGNFIVGPIKENESISLSDTNVNIPTIRGTNVLTVDTAVQPSNVYVKSRHESSYETIMRERYEEAQAQLDALN